MRSESASRNHRVAAQPLGRGFVFLAGKRLDLHADPIEKRLHIVGLRGKTE
jgi:hypothetical protein